MTISNITYSTRWYPRDYSIVVQENKPIEEQPSTPSQNDWRQESPSISSVVMNMKNTLELVKNSGVIIQRMKMVENYLLDHIRVIPVLKQSVQIISEKLKSADQLILDLYQDPEYDDEFLVIYARQRKYNDDFIEQIEQTRKEYQYLLPNTNDIFLTTDFQPPVEYV